MDGLDEAGCPQEAPAGSHQVCEDGRPLRAWTPTPARVQAQQRVNSADGLRLDTLGTVSISDLSSSIAGLSGTTQGTFQELEAGEEHQDKPDHGGLDEFAEEEEEKAGQGDHSQILEEEEEEEEGNENSVRKIPMEETVRTVCEQAAKSISEILSVELRGGLQAALREKVLGAELRGGLQAALRGEVSRAVREEFQRCFQELKELEHQRILVENRCQADGTTTVPVQFRPGHSQSEDNLPWPTRASFPQSQTSSKRCLPRRPVMPDPCTHKVATANCGQKPSLPWPREEASRGQKLILRKHGDEAHHHTGCGDSVASGVSSGALPTAHHHTGCGDSLASGVSSGAQPAAHCLSCGDSFAPCASNSGQSIVDEEQSVISVRQSYQLREIHELLQHQGLAKYVPDLTSPRRSSSSPKTRTEPMPWRNSGSRTRKPPPQEVCSTACLVGADPRDSRSPPEKTHKWLQDAGSQHRRGPQYTSTPTGEEGCHSSQTQQDSCSSFSSKWDQRPTKPEVRCFFSTETSMSSSEEIVRRDKSFDSADSGIEGSLVQSTSQRGSWCKINCGIRVPTVEMLMMNRDDELVSHLSLDGGNGELDSVAPTGPGDESARRSWFAALARNISSQLGRLVAPTCAIILWAPTYPWASAFYRWVILGLISKALYHSASMAYKEWEMSESLRAMVLALDTVMGMGALLCILACGALCKSEVLIQCCKLLMAYSYKTGISVYWEEVSTTDFLCTASFWFASVLTMTLESIYFEHFTTAQDLLSHVGCFALFALILMGMSQFATHMCRCLMTMIDIFCCQIIEQPDFSAALREWSLLQALCRTACSSIQLAFVSLQATATAVVLLSIQQVGRFDAARLMSLVPGLIIAMGVFRASLWAAAVTNKCTRVPMLVNSLSVGSLLEKDRMYTVHYIAYSQAGFYIFDLRVTSAAVMKTVYIACAITFFLATKVFGE